jgi:hypothetical protein
LSAESRCTKYIFSRLIPAVSLPASNLDQRSEQTLDDSDPDHCIEKRKEMRAMLVCIVHCVIMLISRRDALNPVALDFLAP